MSRAIKAIYENGVFKPFKKIKLPEHYKVDIIIFPELKKYRRIPKRRVVPPHDTILTERLVGLSPVKKEHTKIETLIHLIYRNE